ncbi:MAG TPA: PAS domain S-box protein [Gemmatimonadales bacterium]|nr:PAS domain S-box protein [Gemmatimonadales bacterium]
MAPSSANGGGAITTPAGRWAQVNPALSEILGYTQEELLGLDFRAVIHPDDIEPNLELFQRVLAGEADGYQLEKRFIHKQGHLVWVTLNAVAVRDEAGALRYFVVQMQDITERRATEAALRESEARFRIAFDDAAIGMAITNPDGRWLRVNRALCDALGYSADELVASSFEAVTHPDDLAASREILRALLAGEIDRGQLEKRYLHKQGHVVRMVLNIVLARDAAGMPLYFLVQFQDITERTALEAQLRQAQKMDAVGQLAGGIAHDFNNLLTAILTHSQFLLGDLPEGPARQDAAVIRETAERAARLTRQLLAFSRKEDVKPGPLDLNLVVTEMERMLGRILGNSVRVHAELAPELGAVLAHRGQLEQILVNLALNARDAMPLGGSLTLRTGDVVVDDATARAHPGLAPGPYTALTVEDTGVGIPPELHGRIFEPFFTTKPVGEGTGLGLSTVYGIVRQWSGYIAVESAPGRGTTFTIYLPKRASGGGGGGGGAPEPPADAAEQRPASSGPLLGSETILVVEDEPMVRRALRRILTRHGYTVLEAQHGVEALQVLHHEATGPIDLVLTDLVMPEMGGRELIAALHAEPEPPKILAMSGYDMQTQLRGEPLPGGTPFLSKPFTVDAVLQAVRAALDAGPARRRH